MKTFVEILQILFIDWTHLCIKSTTTYYSLHSSLHHKYLQTAHSYHSFLGAHHPSKERLTLKKKFIQTWY